MILGLAINAEGSKMNEASGGCGWEGEDWEEDNDSEDDLRIVLNNTNHGLMGMERGMADDVDDDEDLQMLRLLIYLICWNVEIVNLRILVICSYWLQKSEDGGGGWWC